jgi:1-acyl-sn-glycerol-3-phosphate acyltransferase
MLARLRATDPSQPLWQILLYRACRKICAVALAVLYRMEVRGLEHVPAQGGLLLVSNHQSHLDPPLLGVAIGRRNMAALARTGLFSNRVFGWLLRGLGAIPIRQNEGDTAAIRAAIAELRKGRVVLIFPEGSRSPDGAIHPFKRGTWLLLNRAQCDVLPAAVEGAFDAWPRRRLIPKLFGQRCMVAFGPPIPYAKLKELGADGALEHLAREIDGLRLGLRRELRERSGGRLPRAGAGDSALAMAPRRPA